MIQVSIIIVNYNTAHWVRRCVESIKEYTLDICFEIIVVDNLSKNRDIESAIAQFPEIIFLQSSSNIGFGAACNMAEKNAKGDFLFFLNPDTELQNNALKYFVEFWKTHQQQLSIACLGAMLQNENGAQQHSFGSFPQMTALISAKIKSSTRKFFNQTIQSATFPSFQNYLKVDYITGADLFISKENFVRFNGFDKGFFMYFEETDLQKRMSENGLYSYIIEGPKMMHFQGASTEGDLPKLRVLYFKSLLFYFKKHSTRFSYFLFSISWHLLDIKTFFQKILLTFKMRQQ